MATYIRLGESATDIRGGGYGSNAWVAKLKIKQDANGMELPFDPNNESAAFKNEFCMKDTSGASGSQTSGVLRFKTAVPGIYRFKNFCRGSTKKNALWSPYVEIFSNGTVEEISAEEAYLRLIKEVYLALL